MPLDKEGYYSVVGGNINGGWQGEEAKHNGLLLAAELKNNYGWTLEAIAAWFSALSYESTLNPGKIEGNAPQPSRNTGVGYIQWTPSTDLTAFADTWGVPWYLTSTQLRKWELERTTNDSDIKQWFVMQPYLTLYETYFTKPPAATMDVFSRATFSDWSLLELCVMVIEFYTRPGSWENTDNWYRNEVAGEYWYQVISGVLPPTPRPKKSKGLPAWVKIKY